MVDSDCYGCSPHRLSAPLRSRFPATPFVLYYIYENFRATNWKFVRKKFRLFLPKVNTSLFIKYISLKYFFKYPLRGKEEGAHSLRKIHKFVSIFYEGSRKVYLKVLSMHYDKIYLGTWASTLSSRILSSFVNHTGVTVSRQRE